MYTHKHRLESGHTYINGQCIFRTGIPKVQATEGGDTGR